MNNKQDENKQDKRRAEQDAKREMRNTGMFDYIGSPSGDSINDFWDLDGELYDEFLSDESLSDDC